MNNANNPKNLYDDIIYVDDDSTQPAKDERAEDEQLPNEIPTWRRHELFHLPAGDLEEASEENE